MPNLASLAASLILLSALLAGGPLRAEEFLPNVKRIVFLGDSITYAGDYVDLFEFHARTQHPQRKLEILDLGLPSETVSGLSEPGHAAGKFPRPNLHERLDRVLAQTKPDLVFACYGMNDGIYFPPSDERMRAYQDGIRKLREKVTAAGAQIVHLTPPVFDPLPLGEKVTENGVGGPFKGYDEVLTQFSEWLNAQRSAGWRVIDVHTPMLRELQARRAAEPSFRFANDGVHADAKGHAVIVAALVEGLGGRFDVQAAQARQAQLKLIRQRRKLLSDAWLTATGHQRPGMATGLPLAEAQAKAAELDEAIAAARGE